MKDIEIANLCIKKSILEITREAGIDEELIECYGKYKAKINFNDVMHDKMGKLILVTAINPTPYGEGKTTVSIGLIDAFKHIGKKAIGALREPSLGPVFGMKGGATGGGYSQIVPMEDINLHFTGDLHAITSANNLICAAIDNHLYFENSLNIDRDKISFKRCLDVNDRALRSVNVSINTETERKDGFNITAASEIMSILCLSKDLRDLKYNLGNIIIGEDLDEKPVYVRDLKLEGSLTVLLKNALHPNLVQTLENNPVIVHGGPFANIAHGCNSIIATKLALKLSDYVITEAGFGADLGAEKFFDIKCRKANLVPDCVVLVVTMRALKHHGGVGKQNINEENIEAVKLGLPNLEVHLENLRKYTSHIIVALNKFNADTEEEIKLIRDFCNEKLVEFSISEAYAKGGIGATTLAKKVVEICNNDSDFQLLYDDSMAITDKIDKICKEIYHAGSISYADKALKKIEFINKQERSHLPVCIAKTQYSISDNPKLLGYPTGHEILVKDIILYNGAGFITVILGTIIQMPALPKVPNYEFIDIDEDNKIVGLF